MLTSSVASSSENWVLSSYLSSCGHINPTSQQQASSCSQLASLKTFTHTLFTLESHNTRDEYLLTLYIKLTFIPCTFFEHFNRFTNLQKRIFYNIKGIWMNEDEWVLFSYFVCFFYFVLLWSNVTQTIGVGERTKTKVCFSLQQKKFLTWEKLLMVGLVN